MSPELLVQNLSYQPPDRNSEIADIYCPTFFGAKYAFIVLEQKFSTTISVTPELIISPFKFHCEEILGLLFAGFYLLNHSHVYAYAYAMRKYKIFLEHAL